MEKYIITFEDIGKTNHFSIKTYCTHCHATTLDFPFESIGKVLKGDVGKICKKINGKWYIENDDQFKKRQINHRINLGI